MENKDDFIQIRVSKREKALLKQEAESRYMKLSQMLLKPFKRLLGKGDV